MLEFSIEIIERLKMFSASCTVLLKIMDDGLPSQRVDATTVYGEMTSFDFVFILHLMKEIMGITDILCQTLQSKSQDIINAMKLVLSIKNLLQQMRDNKWDDLLVKVKSFCELRNIGIPDFNAPYINKRGRGRAHQDNFTIEHHYRIDLFYASIDSQLQEINGRFSDDTMELLTLSNALNPQNAAESFRVVDICKLVEKFYAQDFTRDEKEQLEMQLKHYEYNSDRTCAYSSGFYGYFRMIIFYDEYCENKASKQNERCFSLRCVNGIY
ncbi:uncharacterized protein LOC121999783 [Zingiber officinale]|uniref:uncharacterized protein LOC121999783 n=1 Tax=Zingiber officinale TaxID=94328 RepID=UPI001C4B6CFE|nr:uncharacterized protein LOC121999783 [Zingiber officinale]